MPSTEKILKEIYLLPLSEREKIAHHLIYYGIKSATPDSAEKLDLERWQNEIARKPFNMKQAAEYLGISTVTLRRWVKAGRIPACKTGRAYSFDVLELKQFKKDHMTLPPR